MSPRDRNRGAALPVALIFGLVLTITASTAVAVGTSGSRAALHDADLRRAEEAARAGLEDYRERLHSPDWWRYADAKSPFSHKNTDFETQAPGALSENGAFETAPGGRWGGDEKFAGPEPLAYRYEVDNSAVESEGILRVRSTGRYKTTTRTLTARFTVARYTDNLLLFDRVRTSFGQHEPGAAALRTGEIAGLNAMARFPGLVHTNNGGIETCGAVFEGAVTTSGFLDFGTSAGTGRRDVREDVWSCSNAPGTATQFLAPSDQDGPNAHSTYAFPVTGAVTRTQAREQGAPGCLYTGPTRVVFHDDGTMTVRSPQTKSTDLGTGRSTECGNTGTAAGSLGSPEGAIVTVPDGGLISVQNTPYDADDANAATAAELPLTCFVDNGVGYPIPGEFDVRPLGAGQTSDATIKELLSDTVPCPYSSRSGDVYLEGTLSGDVTVAGANLVVQTGDLIYADPAGDMLGVVAEHGYELWSPVSRPEPGTALSAPITRTDAVILVVRGPFRAQHTVFGGSAAPQTINQLSLTGSVTSMYEAPLRSTITTPSGIARSGWQVEASYDWRLLYETPPLFPRPYAASFVLREVVATPPAYTSDGEHT